jgi:hypothetical protein
VFGLCHNFDGFINYYGFVLHSGDAMRTYTQIPLFLLLDQPPY